MRTFYFSLILMAQLFPDVNAQVLPDIVPKRLPTLAERQLENQLQHQHLQRLPASILQRVAVPEHVTQSLSGLPSRLPIVNGVGNTILTEVEISPGIRAVEREWLLLLSEAELTTLLQRYPVMRQYIASQQQFSALNMQLVKLLVPLSMDSTTTLGQFLPAELIQRLDRNHIYAPQLIQQTSDGNKTAVAAEDTSAILPACDNAQRQAPLRIGMIDTAIDHSHPAFSQLTQQRSQIHSRDFLPQMSPVTHHGTAVASLLLGSGPQLKPLLTGTELFNAAVFYQQQAFSQGTTLFHLLQAMEWLAGQQVSVINMSLTGPDNSVLQQAVTALLHKGIQVVAAAGNEGPAAPALYPAAYKGVIAATAVDNKQQLYRWANRGPHISFAAPGVAVVTATAQGSFGRESGTSLAAPVVTAALACALQQHNGKATPAIKQLKSQVKDLGMPGHDPLFGYGLLLPWR